jgi:phage terminase large subunit-like protein
LLKSLAKLRLAPIEYIALCKEWAKIDLFFLLVYILNRSHADNDWVFARCREVQREPNGYLDLWAREHYKSTIITFALTIFDIINDPEITIGLFSHTKGMAEEFLQTIKRELEENTTLKDMYPEIFYAAPKNQSPKWTDDAILVKRARNRNEKTIEAWGVVDNQPIGKHFDVLLFDDVVAPKNVNTAEQMKKTTEMFLLSLNLGTSDGKKRMIGTRYHMSDTYSHIMKNNITKARVYPATKDGKPDGEPNLLTRQALAKKRNDMGSYIFGCQMLQNPTADLTLGFKREDMRFYEQIETRTMNLYLIVDPASKKRPKNDYTTMFVYGLGLDENYYFITGIRDKLNLKQRTDKVFELLTMYPNIKSVGYEEYGLQADVEHIRLEMETRSFRFDITELGGNIPKNDRILKLSPIMNKIYYPKNLNFVDYSAMQQDLTQLIAQEFESFPFGTHDDCIDNISRIVHRQENWKVCFPREKNSDAMKVITSKDYAV